MRKTILTTLILLASVVLFAEEGKDKGNKSVTGHVKSEIVDQKSFNVKGLKACQVESVDEDALMEYSSNKIELMTEDIEDGVATSL